MHAAADTLPIPATGPSLGAKWIKANFLVAILLLLTTGLLPFIVDRIPGLPLVSLTTMSWINSAFAFFVVAANLTVYAILTSSVLGEKLPAFSRRAWIAMHLALAISLGLLLATLNFQPGIGSQSNSEPEWAAVLTASGGGYDWINVLVGSLIVMLPFGAAFGGLQALVLRRAARGTIAWIAGSMTSGLVTAAILVAFELARSGVVRSGSGVATILVLSVPVVWVMAMAIVMLPAFNRLAPKN